MEKTEPARLPAVTHLISLATDKSGRWKGGDWGRWLHIGLRLAKPKTISWSPWKLLRENGRLVLRVEESMLSQTTAICLVYRFCGVVSCCNCFRTHRAIAMTPSAP